MSLLRQVRLLTLRSMRARSTRFLLSVFGIVLGVAVMLAIRVTNQAAFDSIVELFANTAGRTNLMITSANLDGTGFPDQILRSVTNTPGISTAAPILEAYTVSAYDIQPDQIGLSMFGANTGGILLHGIDPAVDVQVRNYKLTEGLFLSGDLNAREIVLVDSLAGDLEVDIGDWFSILTPYGVEELKVVGLIAQEGAGQANNGNYGVVPLQTLQELFDRSGKLDQIDILTTDPNPSTTDLQLLRDHLQARLGAEIAVTFPASQGERMTQMLENYQIGLNFLGGVALFVGAFLIYNAFAMTVVERTREFGMLRTIGMSRSQVTGLVLLEAGFLGLVGSLLGVALGVFLAQGLADLMGIMLTQDLGRINVLPADLLTNALVGVIVTFVAAGIPAYQAGRISPMEALRIRAKSNESWLIRRGWILGLILLLASIILLIANPFPYDVQFRLGSSTVFGLFGGVTLLIPVTVSSWERLTRPLVKRLYGSIGGLGSRNIRRSRQRTTLTVAALMVGVAMVIMTRGITSSFKSDLNTWIESYLGGDIYVRSSLLMRGDLADRIKSVDGVAAVAPIRYFDVEWLLPDGEEEQINFMAIEPVSYLQVTRFVFSDENIKPESVLQQLEQGGAVLISSVLSERYGLGPGDSIRLRTRSGVQAFIVAAVVIDFYNSGLVVQGSWKDMRRYFRINDASAFMVKVTEDASIAGVQERIDQLYGQRYQLILESNQSIRQRVQNLIDQTFSLFNVISLIAVVVASLGIVNTLTMSVMERMQEIGMLRAIGMTRAQVVRMVLAEAGLIGIIGDVLGMATGVVLARVLIIGMGSMTMYELTFSLPLSDVLVSVVAALLISQLAAVFPARRAARVKILEAVQYE